MNTQNRTTALIVGGGQSPGVSRLVELARRHDIVIAADGGLQLVREAKLEPAFVTGDFDSVRAEHLDQVPAECRVPAPEQNETDLEKAMRLAIDAKVQRVGLVCVTGSRIDHTFNAVNCMVRFASQLLSVLYDAHGDGVLVEPPGITIAGPPGEKLSLVPAPGASGLRSTGLLYNLDGIQLGFGDRDGISNEMTDISATIEFDSGRILLYRQRPFLPRE